MAAKQVVTTGKSATHVEAKRPSQKPAPKIQVAKGKAAAVSAAANPAAAKPATTKSKSVVATKNTKGNKPVTSKALAAKTQVKPVSRPVSKPATKPAAPVDVAKRQAVVAHGKAHVPQNTNKPAFVRPGVQVASVAAKTAPTAPIISPRPLVAHRNAPTGTPAAVATRPTQSPAPVTQLPRDVIDKTALARQLEAKQLEAKKKVASTQRHGFKVGEHVVYPSHGVGKIVAIEEQVVAGHALELFVINFEQEKMTLRVPTAKLAAVGMRKLAEDGIVRRAMETLKGRARIKRTMWSRRAQEYENKINSGDLVQISEVVRDLFRAETQPEQSYSERQLFEAALDRMSREIAAVEKLDERGAVQKITEVLSKSAKGRATKATEDAAAAAAAGAEERAA